MRIGITGVREEILKLVGEIGRRERVFLFREDIKVKWRVLFI